MIDKKDIDKFISINNNNYIDSLIAIWDKYCKDQYKDLSNSMQKHIILKKYK